MNLYSKNSKNSFYSSRRTFCEFSFFVHKTNVVSASVNENLGFLIPKQHMTTEVWEVSAIETAMKSITKLASFLSHVLYL